MENYLNNIPDLKLLAEDQIIKDAYVKDGDTASTAFINFGLDALQPFSTNGVSNIGYLPYGIRLGTTTKLDKETGLKSKNLRLEKAFGNDALRVDISRGDTGNQCEVSGLIANTLTLSSRIQGTSLHETLIDGTLGVNIPLFSLRGDHGYIHTSVGTEHTSDQNGISGNISFVMQ